MGLQLLTVTPQLKQPMRRIYICSCDVIRCVALNKREGSRQHLVQALVEAASGPVPLSALLPILHAKETGPSASSVVLEVVERVAEGNFGGSTAVEAVLGEIVRLERVVESRVIV